MSTPLLDDYQGSFEPDWSLERMSRAALARLCREYMLVSMYHDRGLMGHVVMAHGQEASIRQADTEWMSSSPIYTARNKENLGITGTGVSAALKNFQFDIGAPHHFLDFQFELVDETLGYFWLPFCGAHDYLRQISNNDPGLVTNMCHHMEDRTFDATLGATNPALRAIPIHRPPKPDELTGDHCRWEVRVLEGDAGQPRQGEPTLDMMWDTKAAQFPLPLGQSLEPGGMDDYAGEFQPKLRLEDLSHAALVRQAKEFSMDVHLLMRAAYLSVDVNFSPELLDSAAPQHLAACSVPLVTRLRNAMGIDGTDMAAIAKMLQLNSMLPDNYVDYSVQVESPTQGWLWVRECAALDDEGTRSPVSWLRSPSQPGFEHIAQAVNPQAIVTPASPQQVGDGSGVVAWQITIDPNAEPVAPHWAAELTGGGGILDFDLTTREEVPVKLSRKSDDG